MPGIASKDCKRFCEDAPILDPDIEDTLLRWEGRIGSWNRLKTLDDWRQMWDRWGDVILPKCVEHRPGTRPAALYVLGEIPPRPLMQPLPAWNQFTMVYVDHGDGTGRQWVVAGEPYYLNEARHLYNEGVIDHEELARHRQWRSTPGGAPDTYPHEMGLRR